MSNFVRIVMLRQVYSFSHEVQCLELMGVRLASVQNDIAVMIDLLLWKSTARSALEGRVLYRNSNGPQLPQYRRCERARSPAAGAASESLFQ